MTPLVLSILVHERPFGLPCLMRSYSQLALSFETRPHWNSWLAVRADPSSCQGFLRGDATAPIRLTGQFRFPGACILLMWVRVAVPLCMSCLVPTRWTASGCHSGWNGCGARRTPSLGPRQHVGVQLLPVTNKQTNPYAIQKAIEYAIQ